MCPNVARFIPRDYYADSFTAIALTGFHHRAMSMEVLNHQRTEVGEPRVLPKGTTGSSAIHHKRTPIASENLCGMARLLHGFAVTAMRTSPVAQGTSVIHRRSVSWPPTPRSPSTTCLKGEELLQEPLDYPEKIQKNLNITRGSLSLEAILIALIRKGLTRQEAYKVTQSVAMRCYEGGLDFVTELKKDTELAKHLSAKEIEETCTTEHYFRHIETIFKRVYG